MTSDQPPPTAEQRIAALEERIEHLNNQVNELLDRICEHENEHYYAREDATP